MQKTFLFAVSHILKIEENIISYKGAGNWKWNLGVAEGGLKGRKEVQPSSSLSTDVSLFLFRHLALVVNKSPAVLISIRARDDL